MDLQQKRLEAEYLLVKARRSELELKVMEKMDEVKRLQDAIKIQEQKEKELEQKLK